ncbi:hypothetical protein SAMN05444414_1416 [Roseovarius marisflavi]|uniref:NADPH-dependent FMN reductase n=1 Tax=Roseovarius marisflavi TaxID=1054996 RepID=A0A1M7DGU9_9RHOB|nr:NAD(P)H-dependent oxidoreductase [Roseovarius marisflavi]SHL78702.1 hypothetical protein SAMN05444414_1416 [Roseovarius marisflavi]
MPHDDKYHYPTARSTGIFAWASRIDQKVFQDKPTVYLSTSPGPGGAASVLASAKGSAQFFGVDLKAAVSVPNFYDVFDAETGRIKEPNALADLIAAAETLALREVA